MVAENEIEKSNVDPETGIHHGVISQHSILEEAFDEFCFDYGKPRCPKCGDGVFHPVDTGQYDFFCPKCFCGIRAEDAYPDRPFGFCYDEDGYALSDYLGDEILVLRSNFYTYAQLSSPRVQGYGNLDSPGKDGMKTYCLGHDWFEGGRAPYPVYRVKDDVQIVGVLILVKCEHCEGSGKRTVAEGDPDNFPVDCWVCKGTGKREEVVEKEMLPVRTRRREPRQSSERRRKDLCLEP